MSLKTRARTSESLTSKEVKNCGEVLKQFQKSKLTIEDIQDKLHEKGTEKAVGFDLPKAVLTIQTLFRSSNNSIVNFKKMLGTAQRNFFSREPSLDISAKAQAYKVKLVALVGAQAQFRANKDHAISELEINLCTEETKLTELKEALEAREDWNERVRTATFDEENEVDPELLQEAMKCKSAEDIEEFQALNLLTEKHDVSPEDEEARAAELEHLQGEIGEEPKEKKTDKAKWKASNKRALERISLLEGGSTKESLSADLKQAGRLFLVEACRRRNGHRQSARKRVETTNWFFFELSPRKNWGRSCRNNPFWRSIGFRWVAKPKPLH